MGSINLGDLPCRLEGKTLHRALQRIWHSATEGAEVSIRIPHPRHDVFLSDLGYVRAILPDAFLALDPSQAVGSSHQPLGVRFEFLESQMELDPQWQAAVDAKEISYDDLAMISRQANNVIQWVTIRLRAKKSAWTATSTVPLAPEMRKQLEEQLQMHISRGDENAAQVIRNFLIAQSTGPHIGGEK